MLQPFGYTTATTSLVHDTNKVLYEYASHHGLVVPSRDGNRRESLQVLDVARILRLAYREHRPTKRHSTARIQRIILDARVYLETGELPYYMMRRWFALSEGDINLQHHFALGRAMT